MNETVVKAASYPVTARNKVKRLHERGRYDHDSVHAILDVGLIAHVGYVIDGQPYVTPTCYWREGDRLFWHGSSASRMLRAQKAGLPVCLTVTHLDGLVLARSGFHHSINYRSVMAFGTARLVEDQDEKLAALDAFVERVAKGRLAEIRGPNRQELKATHVVAMRIEQAAAKVRTGPPKDDAEDMALPVWAGVIEIQQMVKATPADPTLAPGTAFPKHLKAWAKGASVEAALAAYKAD